MSECSYTELRLAIEGMHCANCAANIEKRFKREAGIESIAVNLATKTGKLSYDPLTTDVEKLLAVFKELSFSAEVLSDDAPLFDQGRRSKEAAARRRDLRVFLVSLGFTLVIVFICMVPGMHHMLAGFLGQLLFGAGASAAQSLLAANSFLMLLTLPVQFCCGARFYRGAFFALRSRYANMDLLVALGTTIAFCLSLWITFFGTAINEGMPFFETCAMLISFVLLGKLLEGRAVGATAAEIEGLMNLAPANAVVLRADAEAEVPLSQVFAGDIVLIRPGQRVPVDGIVVSGESDIDEAMLTGEALPVAKGPGDAVTGGTLNTTGALRVRALKVGKDSLLAQIVRAVEDAQGSKAPIQRFADKAASIFVPAILAVALLTFCGWMLFGLVPADGSRLQTALLCAVAVVVVACPCALGLATPTALMVGMGRGASSGVLIKSGEALEALCKLKLAVFDKTGTLTKGLPRVVACDVGDEELRWAAALEAKSEHPYARAVVAYAKERGVAGGKESFPEPKGFRALAGSGVEGMVEGRRLFVGTRVVVDGQDCGGFAFADEVREDAREVLEALTQRFGVESYVLTGDSFENAQAIAAELGLATDRVIAQVKPLEKAARLAELKAGLPHDSDVVAFIGDGLNDAPALASADVGVAMAGGTDVALSAGAVVLMHEGLIGFLVALRLSLATMRKVKQNLFWALVYNVVMIPLAAIGIVSPALAAAAMALSSVSVVLNSLLLKRFK
ncbi:MAG: heavy metal translocating P-type ATPase [Eggerthellaceae bacterium]|nr:heavy metal translocating P-type ATPase [Eggerthellaceae bacterium]